MWFQTFQPVLSAMESPPQSSQSRLRCEKSSGVFCIHSYQWWFVKSAEILLSWSVGYWWRYLTRRLYRTWQLFRTVTHWRKEHQQSFISDLGPALPLKYGTLGDSLSRRSQVGFDPLTSNICKDKLSCNRQISWAGPGSCWWPASNSEGNLWLSHNTVQSDMRQQLRPGGEKKTVSTVAELVVRSECWSIYCSRDKGRELRIRQCPHRETSSNVSLRVLACKMKENLTLK